MSLLCIFTIITYYFVFETGQLADDTHAGGLIWAKVHDIWREIFINNSLRQK